MTIQHAILGFLSREPLTGYDLKKRFADSDILYWSGNNNQIYRALVALHQDGLVTQDVEQPETGPSRKIYTITEDGRTELRNWMMDTPDVPQLRHPLLVQLSWADHLTDEELDTLLAQYQDEVDVTVRMLREQAQRANGSPPHTPRAAYLQRMIAKRWLTFYENELAWVRELRQGLAAHEQ